jgi:UDP-N-acetylmuramate--alanine ligase
MSGAQPGRGLAPARAPRPIEPGERIHIIGAAGAGASAAALLAHAAGAEVTGCDPGAPSPYTSALQAAGIPVATEHDPAHVTALLAAPGAGESGAGIVSRLGVTKALTSVAPDHPELVAAREAGIPVEAWQQVVADAAASHGGRLVAIAGTHGKSTSSGWLVHLLAAAGWDPAAFVGALLPAEGTSPTATARWGRGDVFVVEADEYAGNFEAFRPDLAVVLNAEWDHPDVFADRSAVIETFEDWIRRPGSASREVVVNVGDQGGSELVARLGDLGDRVTTIAHADAGPASITWRRVDGALALDGLPAGPVTARLRLAGTHNAANAACVAAAAARLGLDAGAITRGLESFTGVGRRLQVIGEPGGVLVIDDYAHHPTAIRETIAALRERYPGRRLWAVHEPLTYHRTAAMLEPLATALATADEVVIADIWPGRDPDMTIASAGELAHAVTTRSGRDVQAPGSPEETAEALVPLVAEGDVVLVMGGGRSYVVAERLVERLSSADRG